MTKRTLYTGLAWLMIFCLNGMLAACQSDEMEIQGTKSVAINLYTATLTPAKTRATEVGVEILNENVIKQVDLFLYPKDKATGEPAFFTTFTKSNLIYTIADGSSAPKATLTVDLPLDAYYKLFPPGSGETACTAFVIANRLPEAHNPLPDSKTIANLKANAVLYAPGFSVTEGSAQQAMKNKVQDCFVMYGQADLAREDRNLSGDIPVKRVAAKVSLELSSIADRVTDENGVTWLPDKEHVYVAYRHQMVRTNLGMEPATDENLYTPMAADMSDVQFVKMMYVDKADDKHEIALNIPFYTYPADWQSNENSRPYLVLVVNWKKEGSTTGEHQVTYYEVPVNDAKGYVQSNNYYRIIQEVDVLGSLTEEKPVPLNPSFMILNWGNVMSGSSDKTDTEAALDRIEYLVVDETNIEMHNVKSQEIFFFSSQPIVVVDVKMKHLNVNDENAVYEDITGSWADTDGEYVFTPTTSTLNNKNPLTVKIHNADPNNPDAPTFLTVEHELINKMSKESDYTDYKFEITIQHKDDSRYKETITITQYPMIPVKAEQNSDYNDKSSNSDDTSDKNGYVFLNNGTTNNLGSISGLSGNNSNPNRYIISVTALDMSSSYIIGDPRQTSINNLSWNSAAAQTMKYNSDNNSRRMSYYHPTDETSRTSNMISPQFMIASSYGKTSSLNKENAKKRCAAYQEDGYPAGRWRIPTQAEIEYIVQLSAWGIIPVLFGTEGSYSGTTYWSANGAITVVPGYGTATAVSNPSSNSSYYVRCVYDTWYWTDKCDKTKFTWGDKAGDL